MKTLKYIIISISTIIISMSEDCFAQTLVKLARLPEEEKLALRKKGIAKAATLDPDTICAKWVNLFREVLSK